MARPIRKTRSDLFREGIEDLKNKIPDLSEITDEQLDLYANLSDGDELERLYREAPELKKLEEYQLAVTRMFFGHKPADNTIPINWNDEAFGGITLWSSWQELQQLIETDKLGFLTGHGFEHILNELIKDHESRRTGGNIKLEIYRDKLIKCRTEGIEAAFAEDREREKRMKESTTDVSDFFQDIVCGNCGATITVIVSGPGRGFCPMCQADL